MEFESGIDGGGLPWATAENLAGNQPLVLSLHSQCLCVLSSRKLALGLGAQMTYKTDLWEVLT